MNFHIEIEHASCDKDQHNFFLRPEAYLINCCDERSKEKRFEMETSNLRIALADNLHTITKSVNEHIHEQDAEECKV